MLAPFVDPTFHLERLRPLLPLVGRIREQQVIQNLLTTVADDLPTGARALTLSGEMGVGKTRLLIQACYEAKMRGFRVLEARAYSPGLAFPYFPFVEALRPVLRSASIDQLRLYIGLSDATQAFPQAEAAPENLSLVGAPLVTSLARLFPELLTLTHVQPVSEPLTPDQEKFRLFDAFATLLERIASESPLLLGIDNLQWADSASLELLLYLTVRLRTSRVALIGATRPTQGIGEQAATSVTRVLMELMQLGMWLPLPLGLQDSSAMDEHLHMLLPGAVPEHVMQPLLERAEGNPFFLEELVRTLTLNEQLTAHDGVWDLRQPITSIALPESIVSAVQQRLQHISPACLDLLSVAARFGRVFPIDALAQVMEQEQTDLSGRDHTIQSLLDEAAQASLIARANADEGAETAHGVGATLHVARRQFTFCQGIVYEVLAEEIPAQRLRTLHRAIGQALEQCYGPEAPEHAAELAAHYAIGGERAATLRWSILAGEEAALKQAHRQAISHFRLVLQLLEEGVALPAGDTSKLTPLQLQLTLGDLWFQIGELEQASASFQSALEQLQQQHAAPLLRARANRALADISRMQARYEQALSHLRAASAAFAEKKQEPAQENGSAWLFRRGTTSLALLAPEHATDAEQLLLLQAQASLDILLNRTDEAEQALWQAHQLATSIGDRSSQAFALHLISWIYGWGERIQDAIRLQKQARELYIAIGDPFRAALGEQGLGIIYQALGEVELARRYTQQGLELARRYGVRHILGWLYWNQGVMALNQGYWDECEQHLQLALRETLQDTNARLKPVVLQAQAILHFRRGLWTEAEQLFQDTLQAAANTDWFPGSVALYGHFLAVTGRRAAARVQLDRVRELPEYQGFAGGFYIPFLAEGYLHLDTLELATPYFERIKHLRGFLYYGLSVDRVLGVLATATRDWDLAELAFEDGLYLCRRANNQPEEAAILYEQALMAVIRGDAVQRIRSLCEQARLLFLRYNMQRSATLVDTLLEGVQALKPVEVKEVHISGHVLHLKLSKREREVLQLVAEGNTDREVASTLVLSPRTVNRHLSNIFTKLAVPGRAAAVAYAIRQGLV